MYWVREKKLFVWHNDMLIRKRLFLFQKILSVNIWDIYCNYKMFVESGASLQLNCWNHQPVHSYLRFKKKNQDVIEFLTFSFNLRGITSILQSHSNPPIFRHSKVIGQSNRILVKVFAFLLKVWNSSNAECPPWTCLSRLSMQLHSVAVSFCVIFPSLWSLVTEKHIC